MWNTYRALGGPRKALAASADATLESLQIEEQITAKRVLLRLVRPGESLEVTSSRERVSSLLKIEDPGRVERVIKMLVEASLLRLTKGTVPTDDQVEIAHEALIRNWPRLVEWLEEERVSMRQRLRLRAAAELWEAHGRDPGGLLGGTLLEEAERYSDLDRLEADFVLASRKAVQLATEEKEAVRQRELDQARLLAEGERKRAEEYRLWTEKQAKSARRLRVLVGGLTLAIVLGFLSAIIAVRQRDKAIQLSEASTYNWNMAINRLEKLQQKTAIIGNLEQATKGNIDDLYGLGNIAGIDISHAQGKVNWQAVAREGGISFGAVKATEGIQWVDPAFTTNWQEMKDAGVTRGAYHLF